MRCSPSNPVKPIVDHPLKAKVFSAFLPLKGLAADEVPKLVVTVLEKYNSLHFASPQSGRLLLAFTKEEHRNSLFSNPLMFGQKLFQAKSLDQVRLRLYNLPLAITKQVAQDFLSTLGVVHNIRLDTHQNTSVLNGNATAWITPKDGMLPKYIYMLDRRVRISRSDPSSFIQTNKLSNIPSSDQNTLPIKSISPSSNLSVPSSPAPRVNGESSKGSSSAYALSPPPCLPEQIPLHLPSSIPTSSSIETLVSSHCTNVGISSSFSSSPSSRSIRRRPCRFFGTWAVSSASISLANRFGPLHEKIHGAD